MASSSSSSKPAAKVTYLGKRKSEGDLEPIPILRRHKETSEEKAAVVTKKTLLSASLSNHTKISQDDLEPKPLLRRHKETSEEKEVVVTTKTLFIAKLYDHIEISDIIDFFKDVVQLVRIRLVVNLKCISRRYGYVEFVSAKEAKKALEMKNGVDLRGVKIYLKVLEKAPFPPRTQYCLDHKVCYEDYFRRESLLMEEDEAVEGLDETPEGVLFVANLSPQTKISHIKEFFSSVGEVVSVRLVVNHESKHVGYAFVEFASADEAKKALETKNCVYLHDHKIFLEVAKKVPYPPQSKYNLAEKLCYEDYIRRQNPVIEEDETMEGLEETRSFVEVVAVREKSLFVTRLSSQAEISDIIDFFKNVGEIVHVRLIVDNTGEHVGDGFIEFASANEAKMALEKKNAIHFLGRKIFLYVAKKAPCPPRPKYCIDHKVWYEDYLRRENLLIEEDEAVEGLDEIPDFVEEVAAAKKTIFVFNIPYRIRVPKIFHVFKRVGQIVRLRLIVDHNGEQVGCGFVEFASADEAEEALRKKNYLEYSVDAVERAPYPLRPKYSLAEKLWSKVESIQIAEAEEEEAYDFKKQEVPRMDKFCDYAECMLKCKVSFE
ncbi:hypothetical protein AALP_AA5G265900 [Arabis alpina]|uniref:RRM domain-containing protein n=1 Tax=Arabis alpina TaxID=50452 RepID=A0A087GZJ1_ARAAL|nr:hypothetical protein AALP_AA5G265900 [Arabis alpina]